MTRAAKTSYCCAFVLIAACAGCKPSPTPPSGGGKQLASKDSSESARSFVLNDVTERTGVVSSYDNGRDAEEYSILESLGGGVGLSDLDLDGWIDVVLPGGGKLGPERKITGLPTTMWRNQGDWRFAAGKQARIPDPRTYTHGVSIADYDQDGFPDLLITGYAGLQLLKNQGDGTFEDATQAAGLADRAWSSSAAWGDFDQDGQLDLYVAHYVDWSWENHPRCTASDPNIRDVCSPKDFRGLQDMLYRSGGDGTFADATSQAGLVPEGKGLGVLAADFNDDGRLDVYVANDTTPNFIYLNQGGGVFHEEGMRRGVAVDGSGTPNGSMGIAFTDYNQDGKLDLWVTNFDNETFALYRSEGSGDFTYVSESTGVTNLGRLFVGFGTVAGDLDNDGQEEVVVTNGHVMYHPNSEAVQQLPLLLWVTPRQLFATARTNEGGYFSKPHWGRGVALADLDGDGDLDLVFSHLNEPAALVRNDTTAVGKSLRVGLIGTRSPRDAIGARATLRSADGKDLGVRMVVGGGSYLSQSEYILHCGIPSNTPAPHQLSIRWPSGAEQTVEITTDNLTIIER